jgi:exodeoxyribonuclease VII small subunit
MSVGSESKLPEFEQALEELERLVERLERGELPLEEALRNFERGVELTRRCQSALKAAQQRVEVLLRRDATPAPFSVSEEEPGPGSEAVPAGPSAASSVENGAR